MFIEETVFYTLFSDFLAWAFVLFWKIMLHFWMYVKFERKNIFQFDLLTFMIFYSQISSIFIFIQTIFFKFGHNVFFCFF